MVATRKHSGQQRLDAGAVVIQMFEQAFDMSSHHHGATVSLLICVRFHLGYGFARGIGIQFTRVVNALGLRAEPGEHRHLPGERGAERIDGLDAQPGRILRERIPSRFERLQHPRAHLGRSLARKGNGHDFLS